MKSRMIKSLSLMLALIVLIATAGCGAGAPSSSTEPAPVASTSEKSSFQEPAPVPVAPASGSITLMASQNWIKDVDRELFKKFEQESGIEVKLLVTPDNGYDTLLGTTMADAGNAVDVFMFHAGSKMISNGIPDIALDLSDQPWVDNLENWALTNNSYNGKVYGFSTWGVDYEGIMYNKTYFEENNLSVPTTWDGFVELCDQILALGKMPLYEGINGVWHTEMWFYCYAPAILKENPNFVTELNTSADYKFADNPKVREGLEQVRSFLGAKENGKPKYYTNDGQSEDWFGSYPALINRECIMMVSYTAYPAELAASGSTDVWGLFPPPLAGNDTVVSNGGGVSKYINKNSKNIDASLALLEFLARMDNLETYYAARDDLVTASFKNVSTSNPTTATTEAIERSKSEPPTRINNTVLYWDPDIYKYMQGFAEGTTTVDQFIANIDNHRATMFEAAGAQ